MGKILAIESKNEESNAESEQNDPPEQQLPTFEDFWLLYPRHESKKAARRSWDRLNLDNQIAALVGLVAWAAVWKFKSQEREDWLDYVKLPSTWINNECWEDEVPPRFRAKLPRLDSPEPTPAVARTEMPAHVRAALDRLRAGKKTP